MYLMKIAEKKNKFCLVYIFFTKRLPIFKQKSDEKCFFFNFVDTNFKKFKLKFFKSCLTLENFVGYFISPKLLLN